MRCFWEFFTFELKFRFKSHFHLRLLRRLVRLQFSLHRQRELRPRRQRQRQGPAQRPLRQHLQRCRLLLLRHDHHRRHLRHVDPSRFSARHHQILFTKPISKFAYLGGRWAGSLSPPSSPSPACSSASSSARSPRGQIMPASRPITCAGISSRSSPSSSSRSSSSAPSSSWSPRSRAKSSSSTCRARPLDSLPDRPRPSSAARARWTFLVRHPRPRRLSSITTPSPATGPWSRRTPCSTPGRLDSAGGVFLYNRLLWIAVGLLSLGTLWNFFPMSVEALTARTSEHAALARAAGEELSPLRPPQSVAADCRACTRSFGPATTFAQYLSLTRMRIATSYARSPSGDRRAHGRHRSQQRPLRRASRRQKRLASHLPHAAVRGRRRGLFFYIVATLYAAELVWRERDTHFDGIHDALPIAETTDWLSKLTALAWSNWSCSPSPVLCGIVMQTVAGYYNYELAAILPKSSTSSPSRRFSSSPCSRSSSRPSSPTSSSGTAS